MKLKKIWFLPLILLALVLTGCSNQAAKKKTPVLTKTQVIKKSQKAFKSGQVIQSVRLATDTSSQIVTANTTFGGDKTTVYHINNQTTSKGKTSTSEEWVNMNNVFINGSGTWYKANLEELSGHSYADLAETVMNNELIFDPDSKLVKAYKMKRNGQTYTLNAKITDKDIMEDACEEVADTIGQTSQQEAVFKRILKYGKFQNMTVKMVVKKQKLYSFNVFVNMKLGKYMTARFGQSYGNFGSHDFLKLPNEAFDAKQLPMQKKTQTKKSTKKTSKKTSKKTTTKQNK